jgi:hypothetical protein
MIEMSFAELALLVWAALATSAYLSVRAELNSAKRFIHCIVTDDDFRNEVIGHFKEEAARAAETQ